MSEKRFRANFDVSIYDSETEEYISVSGRGLEEIAKRMNEQQATINELKERNAHNFAKKMQLQKEIKELKEENEQLRQKIKHWVYVDVDNANGCMNCKYDIGSICSILDCGTHDYLEGVSECGLKYWECKDE